MKKGKGPVIWFLLVLLFSLCSCGGKNTKKEQAERTKAEFTVLNPEEIPGELLREIEANKENEIRMSYVDGRNLYLIRGYGRQETGGYSIAVAECSEDKTTLYLDTRLIGPANQEQSSKDPSWPYLVLKLKNRNKEIEIM